MTTRRSIALRRALWLSVVFVVAACTNSIAGSPVAAPAARTVSSTGSTTATSSGSIPVRTGAVPTVPATVPSYRMAPAAAAPSSSGLVGQPWWAMAVATDGTSSLTYVRATNDATSVYVQPTVTVSLSHSRNLADNAGGPAWPGTGLTGRTTGQLIVLTGPTTDNLCSATVIHSAQQNVVVTAAHCLWLPPVGKSHADGGAATVSSIDEGAYFVPDATGVGSGTWGVDEDGVPEVSAPFGVWKVQRVTTNSYWLDHSYRKILPGQKTPAEREYGDAGAADVAFLTIAPNAQGQQIEQVTGGQGALFTDTSEKTGVDITPPLLQLGYPAQPPFDGNSQRYCATRTTQMSRAVSGGDTYLSRNPSCTMNQGSSGGAWFTGFDNVAGAGYVYAVESSGNDEEHTEFGAFLSLQRDYPIYQQLSSG